MDHLQILEQLQARAEELLQETPTLFAYGINDPDHFPALRHVQMATYMDPSLPPDSYFHVEIRLETLVEEALGLPVTGVRILNGAPLTWQGAVLTGGRAIYSRDETARVAFEERVRREYLDFRDMVVSHHRPMGEDAVTIPREEITAALEELDFYIGRLRGLGDAPQADPVKEGAGRYFLQSAITCCLSICLRLIAALKLRPPRDLADIPEVLAEANIVEPEGVRELVTLAETRNRLVHHPGERGPDFGQGLQGHLASLEHFARGMRERLQM
ncbi:MAG: DUF86 domain-containing protein [Candidatus Methylomirabilales bacterium]